MNENVGRDERTFCMIETLLALLVPCPFCIVTYKAFNRGNIVAAFGINFP